MIRDEPLPAPWNMGVDEALLLAGGEPTLRLYGWQPHAVSLGYFQRFADFLDLPPGTPIVRRLTGGGAIHHGDELTFALAVDAHWLPRDVGASYRLLHRAAVDALRSAGVDSQLVASGELPGARPGQRWCFHTPGRDDVVTSRGKLLGSAQRRVQRPRARVLHHGSLVLQRPALTPFVAAVADDAIPSPAQRRLLADNLVAGIARALGLQAIAGELTEAERGLATQLAAGRYVDPAFLRRL